MTTVGWIWNDWLLMILSQLTKQTQTVRVFHVTYRVCFQTTPLKTESCHNDNLLCRQWRQSWHHEDSLFSAPFHSWRLCCQKEVSQAGISTSRSLLWDVIIYPCLRYLGAVSIRKTVLPGMAIPMLKIRRPNGRLIFNMEIAIRREDGLYIETGPCFLQQSPHIFYEAPTALCWLYDKRHLPH